MRADASRRAGGPVVARRPAARLACATDSSRFVSGQTSAVLQVSCRTGWTC
jgi:hypothetical protein